MSFIKRIYLLSFLILFCNTSVFAGGIEASWGFGFGYSSLDLEAEEGNLEATPYASPIHLFYMAEMGSTSRLNVELFHYDLEFDFTPGDTLGTTVVNTGLNFLYEEELKLSDYFKPILGAGLQVSKLSQTSRFQTNSDGTLAPGSPFEDKDDFAASLLISAGYDFNITDSMVFYTRLMQTIPVSNDLTETQFLIAFMFRK
jgi:opacity protein-like surface antigen